jgi:hypothetical protein
MQDVSSVRCTLQHPGGRACRSHAQSARDSDGHSHFGPFPLSPIFHVGHSRLGPFPLFGPPFPLRRTGSPHIGISAASLSDALSSVLCARAMLPLRASCARECADPTWREREHDTMQHTPARDSKVHVQKAKP